MDDYSFESLHTKIKATPKGSVMLVATPPPKGKIFLNTNLWIVSQDLRIHTRSQGLRPMRRHLLPLLPHPDLSSPEPTARNLDIWKNGLQNEERWREIKW
jgi:hypothetical protein